MEAEGGTGQTPRGSADQKRRFETQPPRCLHFVVDCSGAPEPQRKLCKKLRSVARAPARPVATCSLSPPIPSVAATRICSCCGQSFLLRAALTKTPCRQAP